MSTIFLYSKSINFIDSINDSNSRVIKGVRPRKLACDLRCPYYETCAIYGLNVERVFQDGKNNRVKKDVIIFSRAILTFIFLR